jgi:surface protein
MGYLTMKKILTVLFLLFLTFAACDGGGSGASTTENGGGNGGQGGTGGQGGQGSQGGGHIDVNSVTLNLTTVTLTIGSTEQLTATIAPADASNKEMTWSSNNENVATVTNEGTITGISEGVATITVKTEDGSFTSDCFVTVESSPRPFITKWYTGDQGISNDNQVRLPLDSSGTYNFTVKWGDGAIDTITRYNQNEITHTYPSEGFYTIEIIGTIEGFGFQPVYNEDKEHLYVKDNKKLVDIINWGGVKLHNNGYQFYKSRLSSITATDTPDISHITNMSNMFRSSIYFNGDISGWDVSKVTDMSYMFHDAELFNQDISDWNVSKVTTMENMFSQTDEFNQNISSWDVKNVSTMFGMFWGAYKFNQDISSWNVSNVTNMQYMFDTALDFTNGNNPSGLNNWDSNTGTWTDSNTPVTDYMFDGSAMEADASNLSWYP